MGRKIFRIFMLAAILGAVDAKTLMAGEFDPRLDPISSPSGRELMIYQHRLCPGSTPEAWMIEGHIGCYQVYDLSRGKLLEFNKSYGEAGAGVRVNPLKIIYYNLEDRGMIYPICYELERENSQDTVAAFRPTEVNLYKPYQEWFVGLKANASASLFFESISAVMDTSGEFVHIVAGTGGDWVVYFQHDLKNNSFHGHEMLGYGVSPKIVMTGTGPVVVYLETDKPTDQPGMLVKRERKGEKWQPRQGLLQIEARYLDAISVGDEIYTFIGNPNYLSKKIAVLVRVAGDASVTTYDLPLDRVKGAVEPVLGAGSAGIEIYHDLDENGMPVKTVFTAGELESLRRR